tara:strand:- start:8 stop:154 length:147 start_codon:yes stop_codon:yes gene_type:complete
MVKWTLIEALIFGTVATVLSLSFMLLITYLDNKGKKDENVGQSRNRNQ